MNVETSFVKVLGIKTRDNELIPIWDNRLNYEPVDEEDDCSYSYISLTGSYTKFTDLVTLMYDITTKKLSEGIILDFYPPDSYYVSSTKHAIGDTVYYEVEGCNKGLLELQVVDTIYEDYEDSIRVGNKVEGYHKAHFKDVAFNSVTVYCIRTWNITYVLSNGDKRSKYSLHKKYKEPNKDE